MTVRTDPMTTTGDTEVVRPSDIGTTIETTPTGPITCSLTNTVRSVVTGKNITRRRLDDAGHQAATVEAVPRPNGESNEHLSSIYEIAPLHAPFPPFIMTRQCPFL